MYASKALITNSDSDLAGSLILAVAFVLGTGAGSL
jgi:hypothetical protein